MTLTEAEVKAALSALLAGPWRTVGNVDRETLAAWVRVAVTAVLEERDRAAA